LTVRGFLAWVRALHPIEASLVHSLCSDQFCSLVFTLSNLYTIGCAYTRGFDNTWQRCTATSQQWPIPFALASLPFFLRLIQSVRRYLDSRSVNHLINVSLTAVFIKYPSTDYVCYNREVNTPLVSSPTCCIISGGIKMLVAEQALYCGVSSTVFTQCMRAHG
jgi:hypothetical protein